MSDDGYEDVLERDDDEDACNGDPDDCNCNSCSWWRQGAPTALDEWDDPAPVRWSTLPFETRKKLHRDAGVRYAYRKFEERYAAARGCELDEDGIPF